MSLQTKLLLGLLLVLLSFSHALAQKKDIVWYQSFFKNSKHPQVEEGIANANIKLQQAKENGDGVSEAQALKELGLIHLTATNDYERAMDFFIRSLIIEDSLKLKNQSVFTYLAIAKVFEAIGDYYNSAQYLQLALEVNEQFKDVNILVLILNEQGKVHAALGMIENAFENYNQVLEYKDEIQDQKVEAEALFNLGHLYSLQGRYKEALDHHKRALAIRRTIDDKENEALSLNDIGELYRLMHKDEKALANHLVALQIRKTLNDKKRIAESYNNLGVLFFQQKDFEHSVDNLQLGLIAAQESQEQNQIGKSYDYLNQCYKAMGNYEKALAYKDLSVTINDFIQSEKDERQLLEKQNRYVIEKKETEIDKLESDRIQNEKEIQTQKKFKNVLFVLVGLTIIVALLVFYLYILKRRSNKILKTSNELVQNQNIELQDLNATKDKFFSIISHDLKGPLNSLTSFSGLLINHTESLSKEEIQMLAKDLDKSIKNLFALLENLLEWSRSQTGNIDFKPEMFDLKTLLDQNKELLQAQAQSKRITLENKNITEWPINAHKHSINTVVRNLISNAIKFTPENGTITLDVKHTLNFITVSIKDNGVGMSQDIVDRLFRIDTKHSTKGTADEKGTGLGLILCKEFVEKNGGKLYVKSEVGKGSEFYFTLPYSK